MERYPMNPEELDSIDHAAVMALEEQEHLSHKQYGHMTPEEQRAAVLAKAAGLPRWDQQITARGLLVGLAIGSLFCVVIHKMSLGPGIIPSLNIAAGLLGFCTIKGWTSAASKLGFTVPAFSQQENNVIQTFVTACSTVAFTGGFGTFLLAMARSSYDSLGGAASPGNREADIFEPELQRVVPYLLCTSIIGVFMLVFLRKTMIVDYGLVYPSGTATGLMINSFHTTKGQQTASEQLSTMFRWFGASFVWDGIKWLLSGTTCSFCSGPTAGSCGGIGALPLFGFKALFWTWNFDWQLNLVGAGMICPHIVNWSMMVGAIITWGFLWPYIESKEGHWYAAGLPENSFAGLFGYKVFITIALLGGDGVYQLWKIAAQSVRHYLRLLACRRQAAAAESAAAAEASGPSTYDGSASHCEPLLPHAKQDGHADGAALAIGGGHGEGHGGAEVQYSPSEEESQLQNHVFLSDSIPDWISAAGYLGFGLLGVLVIPYVYAPAVRWYHVAVAYLLGPLMALPNSFGAGLTDWDLSTMYGKLGIFMFAAWTGANGGVIVGLAICGVLLSATSTACTLMQDFRTGYLTLCSPRSMFVAQILGSLAGVVLGPLTFLMFWRTGKVGVADGPYPAPFAVIFRAMAIFGTQGFSTLPKHCVLLMGVFFVAAFLINLIKDVVPHKISRFIPIPMAMGMPFYLGAYLAVDMCVGSVILAVWEWLDPNTAGLLAPAVASGLIVGDGLWSVPASMLGMLGVQPPMCMAFGPTAEGPGR